MFTSAIKGLVPPNLPATSLSSAFAVPITQSEDVRTFDGNQRLAVDTAPRAVANVELLESTPFPPTSIPQDTESEVDVQDKSLGPTST